MAEQDFRIFVGTEPLDPAQVPASPGAGAQLALVQFAAELGGPDRDRLRADHGLSLDRYVPNLAYLERLPGQAAAAVAGDFLVRAVVALSPEHKLAEVAAGGAPGPFFATLIEDADPAAASATLTGLGAHDVVISDDREIGGGLAVTFALDDPALVAQVAAVEDVIWIDLVGEIVMTNTEAAGTIQGGSPTAFPLWAHGLHGEGQVIAVLDSGLPDMNHCFFADDPPNTPGPDHRKVLATRDRSGLIDPQRVGHPTFVAAIAAGDERGNSGANTRRGGAWAAKLVCANNKDIGPGNSVLAEFIRSKAAGATIHSNSWFNATVTAGTPAPYSTMSRDVDAFAFDNEDHLIVGSTGNSTDRVQGPPGVAKNTLCVGAAQAHPNHMNLGSGTPGPTADGRRKPDVMAVGCGIESALETTACSTGPFRIPNPCATSWAVPQTSAAAALVRQWFMEGFYPDGERGSGTGVLPSGALLKAVLVNATVDMTGVAGYPSNTEGWGLLKLDRTLPLADGPAPRARLRAWDITHDIGPTFVETRAHDFDVAAGAQELKITLVWMDPAPTMPLPLHPTLNQLDLIVTAPNGTVFLGNEFTGGVSTPNAPSANDHVNTVKMVVVKSPAVGQWRIDVSAIVRKGKQPPGSSHVRQGYALVASVPAA
jgi:Subtilase family